MILVAVQTAVDMFVFELDCTPGAICIEDDCTKWRMGNQPERSAQTLIHVLPNG